MTVELRFFASFREAVGQKELEHDFEGEAILVGELLDALIEEYPDLTVYDEEGNLRGYVSVLKNGRDVTFLDGLDTRLEDGDVLSVFPPVAGGIETIERQFRGISPRAAIQYLENVGGEQIGESTVTGDGWTAEITSTSVAIGPSLELTEVTVCFEGAKETVGPVIERFAQKAVRAGG